MRCVLKKQSSLFIDMEFDEVSCRNNHNYGASVPLTSWCHLAKIKN